MRLQFRPRGHYLTKEEWDEVVKMQRKLENITGDRTSSITVSNTRHGVTIGDSTPFAGVNLIPVKLNGAGGEDKGGAGLHEFIEVNWDGTSKTGGVVFEDCWLVGDFSKAWDIDTNSFGLVFTARDGQNAVILLPYPGDAYYYE